MPGSSLIAAAAAEIAGYLARETQQSTGLTPSQIQMLKAFVALAAGGSAGIALVDPIGGVLTTQLVIGYLLKTDLPPEIKQVLSAVGPLANAAIFSPRTEAVEGWY